MPDKDIRNIGIQDDLMMQKFIAKRAIRYVELEVTSSSGNMVSGYVTGLDDEWLQITTTIHQIPTLINRQHIESISEGSTVFRELSKESQDNIKRFSTRFREICGDAVRESESR